MITDAGAQFVKKAREFGATAAGIASLEALKTSPSHTILATFGTKIDGAYAFDESKDLRQVDWPADARSCLVIAVGHPRDKPELDWSSPTGNTPGNQRLTEISAALSAWAADALGITAWEMPYWVEEGGLFLKDASVLAGLGCIGRNNLLVTPELGPRVRLRALLLDAEAAATGPIEFDPCRDCNEPCRRACPQGAFERLVLSPAEAGIEALPGRDGSFSRARSFVQMELDVEGSGVQVDGAFLSEASAPATITTDGQPPADGRIKWCRCCELACPVGD